MSALLHIVADYAQGDMAIAEVCSAIATHLDDSVHWHFTSVPSFDTISTGFISAQLALQPVHLRPRNLFLYVNCAPRRDRSEARSHNEGEGLLHAKLSNGVQALVVNSGYSLSFLRADIQELSTAKVERGGSQFRSRDSFPPLVGMMIRGDAALIGESLDPLLAIPAAPSGIVAYVDSFGNLKTTCRDGDDLLKSLTPGQKVAVRINASEGMATVARGSFNVPEGEIAFAPGSSGHDRRFWELFQRGGSAWEFFGRPRAGAKVEILP